jgi:GT2 family glycosyltransferase
MPDAQPELSILIVNWNTRAMTLACLESVMAETRETRFEVIVVDNGSADGSAEAIGRAFPMVRLIAETRNHGFAAANNIAAHRARGRYLLLLNSDTLVLDGALDKLVAFARSHPSAHIWGGRTLFADGRLNPTSVWGRITAWSAVSFAVGLRGLLRNSRFFNPEGLGNWPRDSVRRVDIVSGCFLLIERRFWEALGGFDPAFFMYGEEADLCARARAAGASPMMTPKAQIVHYGGASAASHATKIAYVMGARIGLIDRHLAGLGRVIAYRATVAHVALRAFGFGALAAFAPARFAAPAREWQQAWANRADWQSGPSRTALHASVRRA